MNKESHPRRSPDESANLIPSLNGILTEDKNHSVSPAQLWLMVQQSQKENVELKQNINDLLGYLYLTLRSGGNQSSVSIGAFSGKPPKPFEAKQSAPKDQPLFTPTAAMQKEHVDNSEVDALKQLVQPAPGSPVNDAKKTPSLSIPKTEMLPQGTSQEDKKQQPSISTASPSYSHRLFASVSVSTSQAQLLTAFRQKLKQLCGQGYNFVSDGRKRIS